MDKQNVTKKVGTIIAWAVGIIAMLGVLVYIAHIQDNASSGTKVASEILPTDHVSGNPEAKVTLLEYSDFQCPACAMYAPVVKQIMAEYSDRVRFVYRHFPIYSIHENAELAGRAAEAAGQQGKFFEYADILFAQQSEWSELNNPRDKFKDYAGLLELNMADFESYMNSGESRQTVTKDYQSGMRAGVSGTPTFFLNGTSIKNPAGYAALKKILDEALAAANTAPTATE